MRLKGRRGRRPTEREVSRGRSSRRCALAKGRTMGRAKRPWLSESHATEAKEARSVRGGARVKPRGPPGRVEAPSAGSGNERSGRTERPDGAGVRTPEPSGRAEAREQNKGSPGIDGMTVEELPAILTRALAAPPRGTARGALPAAAGETGGDPEAAAAASASSASRPCSTGSSSRPCCRSCSRGSIRPSQRHSYGFRPGRRAHDAVRARRLRAGRSPLCRGCGPGEVLRPGQPRRADGKVGQADRGPSRAGADPPLPRRGRAGERGGDGAARRHAARRPALAAAWRTCSWTKSTRSWRGADTRSCATPTICNVYVRSQASGRAGDGGAARLYARLKLRVNEAKSAVARATDRKFLGFSFWVARDGWSSGAWHQSPGSA